ncbi:unnamed protein product [Pleuronectes platessa]|uniref:Uncharacterized protein n=1 Tax=Pleuronectes platessa TaxID=8262 RepID=A0A9N7ULU2_PLEPL|nr:unnamed protein product [Pleuronectes platessa]
MTLLSDTVRTVYVALFTSHHFYHPEHIYHPFVPTLFLRFSVPPVLSVSGSGRHSPPPQAGFSSHIPSPFVFNFQSFGRRCPLRTKLEHEQERSDSHPVCSAWPMEDDGDGELRLHEGGEVGCLLRLQEDVTDLDVTAETTQEEEKKSS